MNLESILLFSTTQMATLIALTITVTKGLTEYFKVESRYLKLISTTVVAGWLFALVLLQSHIHVQMNFKELFVLFANYLILLLSAMGIYNFIPERKENSI